jgi:hypothetical protein
LAGAASGWLGSCAQARGSIRTKSPTSAVCMRRRKRFEPQPDTARAGKIAVCRRPSVPPAFPQASRGGLAGSLAGLGMVPRHEASGSLRVVSPPAAGTMSDSRTTQWGRPWRLWKALSETWRASCLVPGDWCFVLGAR